LPFVDHINGTAQLPPVVALRFSVFVVVFVVVDGPGTTSGISRSAAVITRAVGGIPCSAAFTKRALSWRQ
jgi:hypothetical protein